MDQISKKTCRISGPVNEMKKCIFGTGNVQDSCGLFFKTFVRVDLSLYLLYFITLIVMEVIFV